MKKGPGGWVRECGALLNRMLQWPACLLLGRVERQARSHKFVLHKDPFDGDTAERESHTQAMGRQ